MILFFKAGTLPSPSAFGSKQDPVFDSLEWTLQKLYQLTVKALDFLSYFCSHKLFLMQIMDIKAFLQSRAWSGFSRLRLGSDEWKASAPRSPASTGRGCAGTKQAVSRPWELGFSLHSGWSQHKGNGRVHAKALVWVRSSLGLLNKPIADSSWLVWGDTCSRATKHSEQSTSSLSWLSSGNHE